MREANPRSLCITLCLIACATPTLRADPPDAAPDAKGIEFFERQIRPLLADRCYQCHSRGSTKANGGLLLDSIAGLLKGSDSGAVVVAGDPPASLLITVVRETDEDLRMPPDGERLTQAQVADLEAWVKMGAPVPLTDVHEDQITANARTHWAFQPVAQPPRPSVKQSGWVQSPVDAYILSALERVGLEPAPPADKRTLIRRATYDLIGLPPTPQEVTAFEADDSLTAFATVVDRLLATEHYGERWGRHWLDVARFATTDGPFAFTYRDYVIRAFNEDLPYDEFLIQQLAADQLELGDNKLPLAALGFLTLGRQFMSNHDTIDDRIDVVTRGTMALSVSCARCHDHKYDPIPTADYYGLHGVFASSNAPGELPLLGIEPDPLEHLAYRVEHQSRQAKLDDFVHEQETLVLKEHRQQTAQCLLLTRDPAKLAGLITEEFGLSDRKILQTGATRWLKALEKMDPKRDPIFAPWFAFAALTPAEFADQSKLLSHRISTNSLDQPLNSLVVEAFAGEPPTSLKEVAERYGKLFEDADQRWQILQAEDSQDSDATSDSRRSEDLQAVRHVYYGKDSPGNMPPEIMRNLFTTTSLMQLGPLAARVAQLDASHPGAPLRAMVLVDSPQPRNSRIFVRGDPNRLGDEAPRQFLSILSEKKPEPFRQGSGRLELARAIASRGNPLTARVMVNRLWLHHFGAGLVATPDDFGLRAEMPSHLDLLDYLAWQFMQGGWSIKDMHRLIMLSSVYQQQSDGNQKSATLDPDNQLLSRMNRRRLDVESLRDTLLFVTGKMDPAIGGRPVALLNSPQMSQDAGHESEANAYSNRRTVYGVIDRNDLLPTLRHFDFANPDLSTAQRDTTTVPQQALFFLNSPFVMQQTCSLAARADFQLFDSAQKRIQYVYQQVFQRDPTAAEMELASRFLDAEQLTTSPPTADGNLRPLRPWERLVHVILMSDELMFVD